MKQTMNIMTIDGSIIPLIGTFEQLENNCNNAIVIDSIPFNSFGIDIKENLPIYRLINQSSQSNK